MPNKPMYCRWCECILDKHRNPAILPPKDTQLQLVKDGHVTGVICNKCRKLIHPYWLMRRSLRLARSGEIQ